MIKLTKFKINGAGQKKYFYVDEREIYMMEEDEAIRMTTVLLRDGLTFDVFETPEEILDTILTSMD
jgi:hypothetical protein